MKSEPELELNQAAERGDTALLRRLFDGPEAPTASSAQEALANAAYHGRLEAVTFLVERVGDINSSPWLPPLILAANMGRLRVVRVLLAAGADPHVWNPSWADWTPLHHAVGPDSDARYGHVSVARALLRAGADPNRRDGHGRTPLFNLREGDWSMLKALVRYGADVEARDNDGCTPLMNSVRLGHCGNVIALKRDFGADARAMDSDGRTALAFAALSGQFKTFLLLRHLVEMGAVATSADKKWIEEQMTRFRDETLGLLDVPDS